MLDDPKSLQNTEEQVKDVLANLSIMSPNRSFQAASPTRSFQAVPPGRDAAGRRAIPTDPIVQSRDESDDRNGRPADVQQHRDGVQVRTGERSETERLCERERLYASKEDAKKRREEL